MPLHLPRLAVRVWPTWMLETVGGEMLRGGSVTLRDAEPEPATTPAMATAATKATASDVFEGCAWCPSPWSRLPPGRCRLRLRRWGMRRRLIGLRSSVSVQEGYRKWHSPGIRGTAPRSDVVRPPRVPVGDDPLHGAATPACHRAVQGVGFRPFVHRLARRLELAGFVLQLRRGRADRGRGRRCRARRVRARPARRAPALAPVETVTAGRCPPRRPALRDRASGGGGRAALIPPDLATCDDCLRELEDAADRRHHYPFVNCTRCGPRYTICLDVPYDRPATSMAASRCASPAAASTRIRATGASTRSRTRAPLRSAAATGRPRRRCGRRRPDRCAARCCGKAESSR